MIRSLLWLCLSTLLTIAGFAGALPTASALMERQGIGAGAVGVITSFIFGGALIMAPFQPSLVRRFGAVPTYQGGKVLAGLGFVGLAMAHFPWMWGASMLMIGLGAGLTWPLTESLLATFAPEDKKGAWMGLFQTFLGAAFALGPFIAATMATRPLMVFWAAAVTNVLTSLPLIGQSAEIKEDEDDAHENLWQVLLLAPGLPLLGFIGGFFENGMHSAITLAALALSWKEEAAIALAGVIGAGAFVVQYGIGTLADRKGAGLIILGTLLVLIGSTLVLPLGTAMPWLLWVIAFVWGAAGGCLYTLAMVGMAQRFTGSKVITATTLMVMAYTVGGIAGPAVAGFAVEWSALWGPTWLFVIAAVLGLPLVRDAGKRHAAKNDIAECE